MIEKDIMQYLQTITALTSKFGGIQKIYCIQAPTKALMPWVIVEPAGGPRVRIAASTGEERQSVRIGIDVGPADWIMGREAMEIILNNLDGFRGDMGDAKDLEIQCNGVTGYPGLNGAYRYNLTCKCRFTYTWASIHPPAPPST